MTKQEEIREGVMRDNVCCPHFIVLDCGDTEEHRHIRCEGSFGDGLGIDNNKAIKWCLGGYGRCPRRPRKEANNDS